MNKPEATEEIFIDLIEEEGMMKAGFEEVLEADMTWLEGFVMEAEEAGIVMRAKGLKSRNIGCLKIIITRKLFLEKKISKILTLKNCRLSHILEPIGTGMNSAFLDRFCMLLRRLGIFIRLRFRALELMSFCKKDLKT